VILGGHSLGASLAAAYAAWDFDGRPGYKDLAGLVLIDGGLLGSFDGFDLAQAQEAIAELDVSNPFLDLLGLGGLPEVAGLFAEIGGYYARLEPTASAAALQQFPLLPPVFNPGIPATNRALLGHAFDRDTSPPELSLLHVNAGALPAPATRETGSTAASRLWRAWRKPSGASPATGSSGTSHGA
jgi:pimeloyl-ACP methyl ester carboxylesterase